MFMFRWRFCNCSIIESECSMHPSQWRDCVEPLQAQVCNQQMVRLILLCLCGKFRYCQVLKYLKKEICFQRLLIVARVAPDYLLGFY